MNRQDHPEVSDFRLERYLLGELPAAELDALRQRIESDSGLGERLAALERSNEELHQRFPPEWMAGQIKLKMQRTGLRRAQRQRSGYRLWAVPAAALILAVVAVPAFFDRVAEVPSERIKGGAEGPQLMIFRKLDRGEERLRDGARVQSGDLVQIVYRSGGLPFGAILSVDGRGTVTQHLPTTGPGAARLAARDTLDFAYELDNAPKWERFFFVAAGHGFNLAALKDQLAAGGAPKLAPGIQLFVFTLDKTEKP